MTITGEIWMTVDTAVTGPHGAAKCAVRCVVVKSVAALRHGLESHGRKPGARYGAGKEGAGALCGNQ